MSSKIIAIVGLAGTGKSLAAEYIKKKYSLKSIYFGGYILKEVKKRKLEVNSNNERIVREDLRVMHGMDVIARMAYKEIDNNRQQGKNIIIDGLYSFAEYIFLKEALRDNLVLIAVHSNKEIRYQRLKKRPVRPLNKDEVDRRDYLEITMIEKGGPIAIADYHLLNNGQADTLYEGIDKVLNLKL
jgi:dephospho-CoA kinase